MPFYSAERKAALLKMMLPPLSLSASEVARREGCSDMSLHYWRQPLVLNSDNGAPVKSVTLLTKMYDLGIAVSRSTTDQQRQPVLRIAVQDVEILPAVAAGWVCLPG